MATKDKKTISSTSHLHRKLNIRDDGIRTRKAGPSYEEHEESLPMRNLNPNSLEFKKRINEENFKYFMELTNIYLSHMYAIQRNEENERFRSEVLAEYQEQLEKEKLIIQKLNVPEKTLTQKLTAELIKRLENLNKQFDEAIKIINRQVERVQGLIQKLDDSIQQSMEARETLIEKLASTFKQYATYDLGKKELIIPLFLPPEEEGKLPRKFPREIIIDENQLKKIMLALADKFSAPGFSFIDQANSVQDSIRESLKEIVKEACPYVSLEEKENYANLFMNQPEAANAIDIISKEINEHFKKSNEKNNFELSEIEENLADLENELNEKIMKRDILVEYGENLIAQREAITQMQIEITNVRNNGEASPSLEGDLNEIEAGLDNLLNGEDLANIKLDEFEQSLGVEENTAKRMTFG